MQIGRQRSSFSIQTRSRAAGVGQSGGHLGRVHAGMSQRSTLDLLHAGTSQECGSIFSQCRIKPDLQYGLTLCMHEAERRFWISSFRMHEPWMRSKISACRHEPEMRVTDTAVAKALEEQGLEVHSLNSTLLQEPEDVHISMASWSGHFGTLTPFLR
jgi:hypothetical protein